MNAASCYPVQPITSWSCLQTAFPVMPMPSIRTMICFSLYPMLPYVSFSRNTSKVLKIRL
ncbi:hypothetical protein EVA_13162 [gut metagenome]|uniref:Uncharacterized protein n=1 Tax=gut metagenome TaxID=749906 RepID=J9GH50_9ZZZZ